MWFATSQDVQVDFTPKEFRINCTGLALEQSTYQP